MLPQFVSAKRGNNSSQLTVISYNMRYGTAEDGVNAWEFRKPATGKSSVSCPLKPSDSAPLC